MASVKIHTGIRSEFPAATVDKADWPHLMDMRRDNCYRNIRGDCRMLLFYLEDASENNWMGYKDREAFVREGLDLDPALVAWAVEGLLKLDGEVVGFDEAVVLGKHGVNQHSGGDYNVMSSQGNSATYTLARLERDHKPLAAKVRSGELSAHAAAIEAGFRSRQVQLAKDPQRAADAIIAAKGMPYAEQVAAAILLRRKAMA